MSRSSESRSAAALGWRAGEGKSTSSAEGPGSMEGRGGSGNAGV